MVLFNVELFKGYCANDNSLMLMLLRIFLESLEQNLEQGRQGIESKDFEQIDHVFHPLKSSLNYFSPDLGELARRLEMKGKKKEAEGLDEDFLALKAGMEKLMPEIIRFKEDLESQLEPS